MASLILSGRAAEERGEGDGCTGHFLVCNSTSVSMKSLSVVCGVWDNIKGIPWDILYYKGN